MKGTARGQQGAVVGQCPGYFLRPGHLQGLHVSSRRDRRNKYSTVCAADCGVRNPRGSPSAPVLTPQGFAGGMVHRGVVAASLCVLGAETWSPLGRRTRSLTGGRGGGAEEQKPGRCEHLSCPGNPIRLGCGPAPCKGDGVTDSKY